MLPVVGRALRSPIFIGIALLGLALTGGKAHKSKPIYQSEAVLIHQDRGGANPLAPQRDAPSARRIAITLQEKLFSYGVLEKLISDFGLYPETVARFGMVGAVQKLQKQDLRFNAREGYTFRISFESPSPEQAQRVVARASELLVQAQIDTRVAEAKETESFLLSETTRVEQEVRSRESELALFMVQHPEVLLSPGVRNGASPSDSSASETASLGLEMEALQLQERLAQLRRRPSPSSEPTKPAVPREIAEARMRAEAELAAAQRELVDKQEHFTEEYPDVKRAALRVENAKARLRTLEERAATATSQVQVSPTPQQPPISAADQSEIRLVQQRLDLIQKQMHAARSHSRQRQVRDIPEPDPAAIANARAQYTELDRRARESREHLSLLETRQFQAEMQSSFMSQSKQGDLVIVDPAYRPVAPIRSTRAKTLIIGGAGTLFLALALSLALAFRDDRLRCAADLRRFGLPAVLCNVPPP